MKRPDWLQKSINKVYARTLYEIIDPGGRLVRSKTKSITREIPNEANILTHIRPHSKN